VLYDKQRLGTKHGCGKKGTQKNKVDLRGNRATGDYMMVPDEAEMGTDIKGRSKRRLKITQTPRRLGNSEPFGDLVDVDGLPLHHACHFRLGAAD
jgi:hypothetical protein